MAVKADGVRFAKWVITSERVDDPESTICRSKKKECKEAPAFDGLVVHFMMRTEVLERMVGVTGIEPVTPTMSM